MNTHKKELKLKGALKLQRELNQLHKQERDTPAVLLDKPIQAGWKRFFVVKKEHQNRNDFRELQSLVDRLNTVVVCRNRSFKKKDAKSKKIVEIAQQLRVVDQEEMEALTPKHFHRLFVACQHCKQPAELFVGRAHWKRPHFHFDAYHLLEFRVKQHYLTHMKVTDGELASRKRRIYNRMSNEQLWTTIEHHCGHSVHYRDNVRGKAPVNEVIDKELKDSE